MHSVALTLPQPSTRESQPGFEGGDASSPCRSRDVPLAR